MPHTWTVEEAVSADFIYILFQHWSVLNQPITNLDVDIDNETYSFRYQVICLGVMDSV